MNKTTILKAAFALLVVGGCTEQPGDDGAIGSISSNQISRDWIEGAYQKQGGTPLNFVFYRGQEGEADDTFFGEIEENGKQVRAKGHFNVGRDRYGSLVQLTLDGDDGSDTTAETRSLKERAFEGNKHFLKIGKNDTILIRDDKPDSEGVMRTAHYKKVASWCGTKGDADCAPNVQATGLKCEKPTCSTKHVCECK